MAPSAITVGLLLLSERGSRPVQAKMTINPTKMLKIDQFNRFMFFTLLNEVAVVFYIPKKGMCGLHHE
jgi:hypothetical protein